MLSDVKKIWGVPPMNPLFYKAGALKVRHHNVCLVNQIHTAQTEYGEIGFLSMEFLEGETLSARLKARGKVPEAEALEIARQVWGIAEAPAVELFIETL